jgi:hypothetical protein
MRLLQILEVRWVEGRNPAREVSEKAELKSFLLG